MSEWKCYGGMTCTNQDRCQGISQWCTCEVQRNQADVRIANRIRAVGQRPQRDGSISFKSLRRIITEEDSK